MNAISLVKKYNSFNGKLVDYQELDTFYHQVKDVVCVVGKGTEHDKIVRLIQNRVGKTLKVIGKDKVRLLVTPLIIPQTKPTKKVKLPSESSGKKKVKIASVPGVKASVSQAIADLVKAKPEKFGKKAMAMQLLYSKFKDADTAELEESHFITKMLEKQQWIEFEKSGNVYSEYSITSDGKKVLESIKGRINSLQVKKQGGELFENLNGYLYGLETENPDGEALGSTKEGQNKIYDMVTSKVLEAMRKDNNLPWRKPWLLKRVAASNYKTKKRYEGVNFFMLNFVAPMFGGKSGSYWLTYKQVSELGGKVKKKAEAWPVLYYNLNYIVTKPERKSITKEQYESFTDAQKEQKGAFPIATVAYYNVFNQEDIEGIDFKTPGENLARTDAEVIEAAERIVEEMPNKPEITHHKIGRAFYSPSDDLIKLPEIKYFVTDQEYYSTLFHELIHSTGHKSRLDRFEKNIKDAEDKDDYAFEELIAELGACYLNAEAGTLYFTLKNSATYLKSWQKKLENIMQDDNRFFIRASAKATQAANYILNVKQDEQKEVAKKQTSNSYAVDASVLAGIDFKQYKLTSRWKSELGDFINSDNQLMFWGMPGHGKTVLQLQLAQYFAEVLGLDTLYIANEEFKRSTLAKKIKDFKIGHPKLKFAKTIDEKEISKYQVVFFDSINSLGMTLKDYLKFRERHSDKVFVLVVQSTKDGNFRGGQEWEHEVDIAGEVINRKLTLRKHRLDSNLAKKAEQMAMKAAINEAKKKKEIRQAISNKSTKEIKTVTP
jgi:antirestriction protein ArdC